MIVCLITTLLFVNLSFTSVSLSTLSTHATETAASWIRYVRITIHRALTYKSSEILRDVKDLPKPYEMLETYKKEYLHRHVSKAAGIKPSEESFIESLGMRLANQLHIDEADISKIVKLWHTDEILQFAMIDVELACMTLLALIRYAESSKTICFIVVGSVLVSEV